MPAHKRLTAAITAANNAGRPALVPFITAGYPEPGEFINTLKEVAQVGDVVELGIPFSDPMADGMTIQRSSFVALQNGVSLKWIFDELKMVGDIDTPLVMMSYINPLLAFGYDRLAERALEAGVCAFIVPDLPFVMGAGGSSVSTGGSDAATGSDACSVSVCSGCSGPDEENMI